MSVWKAGHNGMAVSLYWPHSWIWSLHSEYVYMHTNIPLLFRIWQYSEFDTGHVNTMTECWIFSIRPYSQYSIFWLRRVIFRYYLGFRRILWTFIQRVRNMCLNLGFYCRLMVSSVRCYGCCIQTNHPTVCKAADHETQLLLNIMKDLDINRFLDMRKHSNVLSFLE